MTHTADVAPPPTHETPAGRFPFFIRRTLGLLIRPTFRYNAVTRLRWGDETYLLTDPADIKHVLLTSAANYVKTERLVSAEGRRRAGSGLLTSTGRDHHDLRRLLFPAFHRQAVATYAARILNRTERELRSWRDGAEIDIAARMTALSKSVILAVLFGDLPAAREAALAHAIRDRRRYTEYHYHSRLPFRDRLPTRTVRANRAALETLDAAIHAAIAERRAVAEPADDLISLLLHATHADGTPLSDAQVRDEVLSLTHTGYETVGDGLAWLWYLLATHPGVEARLVEELDAVLGDRSPGVEDVPRLEYAERLLAETLRLYPPTWIYTRVPIEADTLASGAEVPAGARLYLCQYLMHRHPDYFPDPERFDPERFADAEARRRIQYVYFPFGMGAHRCIGEHLALLEAILVIAAVARRYRLTLVDSHPVRPYAGITLRPANGVRVRVYRR